MKRILVALDESERAEAVLKEGTWLAEMLGAEVILLRAVTLPVGLPPGALSISPDELGRKLVESAREQLVQLAGRAAPKWLGSIRVEVGTPWRTICDVGRVAKVDLIVIGSHGYGGIDRVLGTTAAKVVNHAGCSVMVVRPPA